jgi:hypothetical protein
MPQSSAFFSDTVNIHTGACVRPRVRIHAGRVHACVYACVRGDVRLKPSEIISPVVGTYQETTSLATAAKFTFTGPW